MVKPKERVISLYENFFKGKDFQEVCSTSSDILLLKANTKAFEEMGNNTPIDALIKIKANYMHLFDYCLSALNQDNQIKIINALLTLSSLFKVFIEQDTHKNSSNFMEILLREFEQNKFQELVLNIEAFFQKDFAHQIRQLSLKLILLTLTIDPDFNKNPMVEIYLLQNLFETLFKTLASAEAQIYYSDSIILILVLLYNYQKYEKPNPYVLKLSIVNEQSILNVYGSTIASTLSFYNKQYSGNVKNSYEKPNTNQSFFQGIFSSLNMFASADEQKVCHESNETGHNLHINHTNRSNLAALLAFYEGVHSNRSFITTLTHAHVEKPKCLGDRTLHYNGKLCRDSGTSGPDLQDPVDDVNDNENFHASTHLTDDYDIHPCNLLTIFLEYTSILFLHIKDPVMRDQTKLSFLILTCLAEDPYANSVLHDLNLNFAVSIHKQPLRHRRLSGKEGLHGAKPLICSLLDLLTEFLMCHLMKNFPDQLYSLCLGIVHRVLCYQKKTKTRVTYPWSQLWSALISTLKFLVTNLPSTPNDVEANGGTIRKAAFFTLVSQVITIFNLFITFGDNFLPSPQVYDELYYELVRMHQVFDNLQGTLARLATSSDNVQKEAASKLSNSLVNIAAIILHFRSKIKYISDKSDIQSFTRENVLDIVRSNYDSLTLKLHQNLDVYVKYSERGERTFLESMVSYIVKDVKSELYTPFEVDYIQILKELS